MPLAAANAAAQACVARASSAPPLTVSGAVRCVARVWRARLSRAPRRRGCGACLQRGCCTASERCALAAIDVSLQEPLVKGQMLWSACAMSRWCARFLALPLPLLQKQARGDPQFFWLESSTSEETSRRTCCASCSAKRVPAFWCVSAPSIGARGQNQTFRRRGCDARLATLKRRTRDELASVRCNARGSAWKLIGPQLCARAPKRRVNHA